MRAVTLRDVCEVIAGQSPVGSSYNEDGNGIEFHQGKKRFGADLLKRSSVFTNQPTKIAEPGDILISVRAPVGPVNHVDRKICIGRGLAAIRPSEKIDIEYLFYFLRLNEVNINGRDGATFASINKTEIESIIVPLPSPDVQRLVVARLNTAFEKIDRAIELTQKNIQNVWNLFNSVCREQFESGNLTKRIGDVIVLQRGYDLPRKERTDGMYPLVSSSGVIDSISEFKVVGPGICTGRSGSVGATFYVENDFWPLNTTLYVKEYFGNNVRYCYWLLHGIDLKQYAGGTGVPTLNRNIVHEHIVKISPISEQKRIANKIDAEFLRCQTLSTKYQAKLSYLKSLKQSMLSQAFSEGRIE